MLRAENCGLLVIDIQGKLAKTVAHSKDLIAQTQALILGCKALEIPVIWLEQTPDKLGATTPEIAQLLQPGKAITKTTFSGYANSAFVQRLTNENKQHWILCGIEAHICVYQTACDLLSQNLGIVLIEDAISSRNLAHKTLALTKLQQLGAQISNVEMCLYELLRDSQHPKFKTILNLIK
ncbi:isochorismatase [Pseudoalteromonas sp. A25]|uniref:isochorismatase family protein n=1 Tax=Pseudoalteromonas sp. A25 TaxID=116092 RepID=UPI001260F158|nr:isochorismatase family protein [Pseudoalteromonas sp. A25]BBN83814.1 isochorismatase [Pseudoalteromonas sp. A25]